jgi:hypothetical protein
MSKESEIASLAIKMFGKSEDLLVGSFWTPIRSCGEGKQS